MQLLETLEITGLEDISDGMQIEALKALEGGKVVFLPKFSFQLSAQESAFLSPSILSPKSKNISYDAKKDRLSGTSCQAGEAEDLKKMVARYALESRKLIETLFPHYAPTLQQGRTSFRPAEVFGRPSSYRKDDTRLHVDAFPATPVQGKRILRVFCNVNPEGKPRVWKLGEPFSTVVEKMVPRISPPLPGTALLLKLLKVTKQKRSLYDHYMLHIHDEMKGDLEYQAKAEQQEIRFPSHTMWIVYSDQVSHAALSGQHLFEQTFYLDPSALANPESSPLKVLERFLHRNLISPREPVSGR
ncbi:MAG: Kdo hydroxylase family protein [Verrucomicrobia bacterium]|nr:Kdo hydroxylase family protein [Verrucomicrobiota bacterium]